LSASALLVLLTASSPDGAAGQTAAPQAPLASLNETIFPVAIKSGNRYLVDATDRPFLIHGDTAWSLIVQLKRPDAEMYLEDRRVRGFNTILVNLLEHRFASNPPANAYGQSPFLRRGDFSAPNEAYFAHADWVLSRAAEKGMLVLLVPAYLGFAGGVDGWYKDMVANGPAKLRAYGQFLGRRYGGFSNILWVHGGDFNPPRKDLVRAIAEGIREADPQALHTAHCAPETAAIEYWTGEPWLQVNNIYTYKPVYTSALSQFARTDRMPFFLLESAYENEHRATELRVRTQAYHALLSGAAGQIFGNNPMWHFDGRGIYPAPTSWQQALNSRGAQSVMHARNLFATIPWWTLEPDSKGSLVAAGAGEREDRVVAAYTHDRRIAVVYLPAKHEIQLDLSFLHGPSIAAQWYDPASGQHHDVAGSPFATKLQSFSSKVGNSAGLDDWILVLNSVAPGRDDVPIGNTGARGRQ
jgi:hypothetical protein